jgi:hypothetical protein
MKKLGVLLVLSVGFSVATITVPRAQVPNVQIYFDTKLLRAAAEPF